MFVVKEQYFKVFLLFFAVNLAFVEVFLAKFRYSSIFAMDNNGFATSKF